MEICLITTHKSKEAQGGGPVATKDTAGQGLTFQG